MLNYATVGSNDLEAAKAFYDQLLGVIGMKPMMEHHTGGRIWSSPDNRLFGVLAPFNGEAASPGNGAMFGFMLESREQVQAFYDKAMDLGGKCEGAPGLRGPVEAGNFAAYFRDLDGNKLCAIAFGKG